MTTRRNVLMAGSAVAAAGALAACGAGGSTSPTTRQSSSGGASGTLGPAADVPVGGGKVYDAQQIIVTQPTAGQFHAFSAICPHQGCLVAGLTDGVIVCPCHGSAFNVDTGAVEQGPAVQGLAVFTVKDANGTLTLG